MLTKRKIFNKINNLKKSFLLIGPRQTGKSTLIQALNPDLEVNLADEETFVRYLSDPGLIKKTAHGHRKIFVDEVQRIPSILNTIQTLIDKNKSLQFYLTGSSARKLKRGQANLLPGRILSFELGPLSAAELGKNFEFEKAIQRGLLPGIYFEDSQEIAHKILRTYSTTYLKEEIQAEALTRNLEGFSRFFEVVAGRSGDTIDFTKFSSQAMIERTTAKRYFDILVDTLILYPIEPFTKSSRRRLVQHPKYYFFDVGVLNACLNNFNVSQDRIGNLFEHLFLQLVLSAAKSDDLTFRISSFRTEGGAEVDFIIEKEGETFAVEVKASKNIGKHDLKGLKSFETFYKKKHKPLIVYLGGDKMEIEDIPILGLEDSLDFLGLS
jgi:predicted AAA+ superfamily ATPase